VAVLPAALALLPVPDPWGDVLGLVRWPILAGIVILALAIVYRYAPDRAARKWQWISWGAAAATVLWMLGSIAFTLYVSRVGRYDKTYGSLGAVIILLQGRRWLVARSEVLNWPAQRPPSARRIWAAQSGRKLASRCCRRLPVSP
jgi:hypothetical protein